jgi:hypothetical protein
MLQCYEKVCNASNRGHVHHTTLLDINWLNHSTLLTAFIYNVYSYTSIFIAWAHLTRVKSGRVYRGKFNLFLIMGTSKDKG